MSASACLFDVNVWVALIFERHQHHALAKAVYRKATKACPAIFCRVTQQGLLRIASTPSVSRSYGVENFTNLVALETLERLMASPLVVFRDEPAGMIPLWHRLASRATASPKVWTDAYLAAFAIAGRYRLATLDGDFQIYEKSHELNLVLLKP